jgi:hypothetical protein
VRARQLLDRGGPLACARQHLAEFVMERRHTGAQGDALTHPRDRLAYPSGAIERFRQSAERFEIARRPQQRASQRLHRVDESALVQQMQSVCAVFVGHRVRWRRCGAASGAL